MLKEEHPPSQLLLNSGETSTSVSRARGFSVILPSGWGCVCSREQDGCGRSHLLLTQPGSLLEGDVAGVLSSANPALVGFHILAH